MDTVIFETDNAIFSFDLADVQDLLSCYSSEHQVEEATDLLRFLESSSEDPKKIPIENDYFGYIALDLFNNGNGSVFCKSCQKTYQAKQLQSFPLGFGESPFTIHSIKKGGFFKRLFGQRTKRMGMMGGKEFKCPEGHELIFMRRYVPILEIDALRYPLGCWKSWRIPIPKIRFEK